MGHVDTLTSHIHDCILQHNDYVEILQNMFLGGIMVLIRLLRTGTPQ